MKVAVVNVATGAVVYGDVSEAWEAERQQQAAAMQRPIMEQARAAAYQKEADPLFFKWQAGEATEAEWLAKREEIRARFPYPEES